MSNLTYTLKEDELVKFFETHELKPIKCRFLLGPNGQSKGAGIVEFESPSDAEYAVKSLNGKEYDNSRRKILIDFAKPPTR